MLPKLKRHNYTTEHNPGNWMVVFADLLALLLTFFVMMLSMNTVENQRWESLVRSFSAELNPARASFSMTAGDQGSQAIEIEPSTISLDYLSAVFEEAIAGNRINGLAVHKLDDRVIISVPAALLFNRDGRSISARGNTIISDLAEVLGQLPNVVYVAGHNNGTRNPSVLLSEASGWIDSIEQAMAVAVAIKSAGFNGNIRTYGYGNSRAADLNDSISDQRKLDLARRVDIAVINQVRDTVKGG